MLVLTRKSGESVQIGNDIVVTVLMTDDGRVRLGFDVPAEVPIVRTELLHRSSSALSTSLKTPMRAIAAA